MPRAGITSDRVVDVAIQQADTLGLEQLTLAGIATELGVKVPSLYKHVAGLSDVRRLITIRAKTELTSMITRATAGLSRSEAVHALASSCLEWARRNPSLYAASLAAPRDDDAADIAASTAASDAIGVALRGFDLDENTQIDAIRSIRAIVDGFVGVDAAGGFKLARSIEDSLTWALDGLTHQLETGHDQSA